MNLFTVFANNNIESFKEYLKNSTPSKLNYDKNNKSKNIMEIICQSNTNDADIYLELILKHGADPNIKKSCGYHILSDIQNKQFSNIRIFELLLEYGANINYMSTPGLFLHNAAINDHLDAVKLAMKFGAKNDYLYSHYSLGKMTTVNVCKMTISPEHAKYGFRGSSNPYITQCIITLLENYVPINVSYQDIRKTQVLKIDAERQRLAEIERLRLVDIEKKRQEQLQIESEKKRQEQLRIDAERQRLAEIERLRLVDIENKRQEQLRIEAERQEQLRIEAEKQEQLRIEAERQEQLHIEAEKQRQEQLRIEAERQEQLRIKAERQEQLRIEAKMQEQLRIEAERQKQTILLDQQNNHSPQNIDLQILLDKERIEKYNLIMYMNEMMQKMCELAETVEQLQNKCEHYEKNNDGQ